MLVGLVDVHWSVLLRQDMGQDKVGQRRMGGNWVSRMTWKEKNEAMKQDAHGI